MLSHLQQALIDLMPADGVATINQHPVRRDDSGAWVVGRNMVCDGVRRCTSLPEALTAVQTERRLPPERVDPTLRLAQLFEAHGGPGAAFDLHQLEGYAFDPDGVGKPAVYRVARARGAVHDFTWRGISGMAPTLTERDSWHNHNEAHE